jgi:HEAT repeat protein
MWPCKPSLEKLLAKRDVKGMLGMLERTHDKHKAEAIVKGLKMIGPPALEPLIGAVDSPDDHLARWACYALGRIGVSAAVDVLIGALERAESVRESAAYALGQIGDRRAVGPLSRTLERELAEGEEGLFIIRALVKLGDPAATEALFDAARVGRRRTATEASTALRELGTTFEEMRRQKAAEHLN